MGFNEVEWDIILSMTGIKLAHTHTYIYIDIIPRRFIGFYGFYCNEMEWDIRYD